jgi:dihydrofolate reductase
MRRVRYGVAMSLDGYIAGPNAGPKNPLGDGGRHVHKWMYAQETWRQHLGFKGGDSGSDDTLLRETFARAGAYVMGRRMFDEGEANWPEEAPFRTPVFVVTSHAREPWARPGGTTFYFVTDGVESAVARAKAAAGEKDVRIAGGATIARQALEAGLVDELNLHLAPVMLGGGVRLLDGLDPEHVKLEQRRVLASPQVTHLYYDVIVR